VGNGEQGENREAKVRGSSNSLQKINLPVPRLFLYTVNAIMGNPLPSEIVKLASGFTGGIGRSGSVCGALTGGVMALGLAFGRTNPGAPRPKLLPATRELIDWFEQAYGSCCCGCVNG